MTVIRGRVWRYGDNVNTDVIFPGKYTYTVSDPAEMSQYALEDLDPRFAKEVQAQDVIVAGKNWGCGSSREQAVTCLKQSGLGAIVAKSIARIYYRNCLNAALPALICPEAVDAIQEGESVEIDLETGVIRCAAGDYNFSPLPESVMQIFNAGGLIEYTRRRLEAQQTSR
ncbi:MAG: 3-isopropylmalate dehydratase [Anaerolineales bacterium]|nr:3-isopropylmalate dehydratase [Anaerolineales bacterium]